MRAKTILKSCFIVMLAGMSAPVLAETLTYSAVLSGANEIPANDSGASGEAVAILDTETRILTWTVTFDGLSGPPIGAHFHGPAGTSANAGVLLPLGGTTSPVEGSAEMSEEKIGFLQDGSIYINIHTERYPGGELRGNLAR